MNHHPQRSWKKTTWLIFPACASALFALFFLCALLLGHFFITPDDLDTPTCITAATVSLPVMGILIGLVLPTLNVIGLMLLRASCFWLAAFGSLGVARFFFCEPLWGYLFIWGDGRIGTTLCEHVLDLSWPLGILVGVLLSLLNVIALMSIRNAE